MHHYTYRITNTKLNKHYYGLRSSEMSPDKDLGFFYFSSSTDMNFIADQKHNPDFYQYKVLMEFDTRGMASDYEIRLHKRLNVCAHESFYNRANATSGGFGINGIELSDEHRKKIGDANRGQKKPDGFGEHLSKINLGKAIPDWVRRKMSDGKKGKPGRKISESEKEKLRQFHAGKTMSEEAKAKMSKAKMGLLKDRPQQKVICPHCEKEGGLSAMKRYHFENCNLSKL